MSWEGTQQVQEQLQEFEAALEGGGYEPLAMVNALSNAEIALLLESSPPRIRKILWDLLESDHRADVMPLLGDDVQANILQTLGIPEVAAMSSELEVDDMADLLQQLPDQLIQKVLQSMDDQRRRRIEHVISYSEDTAGGLMNTDVVTVRGRITLDVVLRYLRRRGELPESTDALIVVDRRNHYRGMLSLSTLLVTNQQLTVRNVMDAGREPISVDLGAAEVAALFEKNDWLSAPVVDDQGLLLGRITVDDVVDVIRERSDHSLMGMAGLKEAEDTFASLSRIVPRRTLWLGINLMTAFLAALVIKLFDDALEKYVALAVLMPIVASMSGVAGSQTLTIIVRGMALGQIGRQNAPWLVGRESLLGLYNGGLWAVAVACFAWLWFGDWKIAGVLAMAMLISLLFAALSGTLLPLALNALKIDPAVAGSVVLTTFTDVIAFFSFLGLASWLLV